MDYFYCPPDHIAGTSFTIEGDEFAHLVHVMRKKAGDTIRIVDGQGTAYDAIVKDLKKKTAHGTLSATYNNHNEPELKVTLAAGLLKNPSRYDFLVEKTTELGVHTIIPMKSRRVITGHSKTDRWQKLALAAMKQSCRSFLPEVTPLQTFEDVVQNDGGFDAKIIAHEQADATNIFRKESLAAKKNILILIGPEGGFTDEEVEDCIARGYQTLYLGSRRLRTETAAITTLALVMNGE